MMSNPPDQKAKSDIKGLLNGFNYPELVIYVCSYLGVFDDIRAQIEQLISGKSDDLLYSPEFLYESVLVPCFAIGMVLSKKHPMILPKASHGGTSASTLAKERRKIDTKYKIFGFLISFEMVVDYFRIMQKMTQQEINKIRLDSIFPKTCFTEDGKILLGKHAKFILGRKDRPSVHKRASMVFEVKDMGKLSPIFKAMPLAYLHTKFAEPEASHEYFESFTNPSVALKSMYPHDNFWYGRYSRKIAMSLVTDHWVNLPKALLPSFWWKNIAHSSDLLKNNDHLEKDCLKISAYHSSFDMHKENASAILDECLKKVPKGGSRKASEKYNASLQDCVPNDLSSWVDLSEESKALLQSDHIWKSEEVNPKALRDLALHCKAMHEVHTNPTTTETLTPDQNLGFYQMAFFNLWNLVQENHGSVSTEMM